MKCLNCNSEATGSYCYNCGQKTSTVRFSIKHIFKSDIANQYYSFFKNGLFFTLKELATRPGYSIREYILGKRVNHMNYMSLYLLITAGVVFIEKYVKISEAELISSDKSSQQLMAQYFKFLEDNPKTVIFVTIPFLSVFTFLFFKKSNFNFSENLILNTYKASALLLISKIVFLFALITSNTTFLKAINELAGYGAFAYSFWFLYQFFYDKEKYSMLSIITRITSAIVFGILSSTIVLFLSWFIPYLLNQAKH